MPTAIIFHEVRDGTVWANAWKQGPGSRHEMFGKIGVTCRNFRDPNDPDATGVMAEIPDMAAFQELLQSEEGPNGDAGGRPEGRDPAGAGRVHPVADGGAEEGAIAEPSTLAGVVHARHESGIGKETTASHTGSLHPLVRRHHP
jgi:hypothetical protein